MTRESREFYHEGMRAPHDRFDGKSDRIRINGRAHIIEDQATIASHHAARLVVRVACELYSNCPRSVHDLATGTLSDYLPRPNHTPPPPQWKAREYIRDILPQSVPTATRWRQCPPRTNSHLWHGTHVTRAPATLDPTVHPRKEPFVRQAWTTASRLDAGNSAG